MNSLHPRKHFIERQAHSKGYRVSTDGNTIINSNCQPVKTRIDTRGYPVFSISAADGMRRSVSVHRLQAFQKYGERIYEPGLEVRHKNDISTDNSAANILIGTHSDNMMDRSPELRARIAGMAALKFDHAAVRMFYEQCRSYKKTIAQFGMKSKGTLHHILAKSHTETAPQTAEQQELIAPI